MLDEYYYYDSVNVHNSLNENFVISSLNYGVQVWISTSNSISYGSHLMVIYGYREVQIIQDGEYVNFYLWCVDDCYSSEGYCLDRNTVWYDANRSSSNRYYYFEFNTLTWDPNC